MAGPRGVAMLTNVCPASRVELTCRMESTSKMNLVSFVKGYTWKDCFAHLMLILPVLYLQH